MGNKSKKPIEKLVGKRWRKGIGRDVARTRLGGSWGGLAPENLSVVGVDVDAKGKKSPRAPLKAKAK